MGSKGSQKTESTSTQQTSADPRAQALYTDVLSRAEAAAQQPYQAYQGQLVAGFTPDQLAAMQGVRDVQGAYAPYLQTAAAYGQRAGEYITPSDIQRAMSPYIQDVVGSTVEQANRQYLKAMSQLRGTEAQQGAFGGTRAAVAEANLAAEQQANREKLIADLMNKGYTQAVAQAQADRAAAGQGAQIMQGIAGYEQALPLAGYNQLLQTGGLQQQLAQQQLAVPYQQFLQQQAYPYQQAQWLASIGQGIGPLLGGTSTGQSTTIATPAQPSLGSQIFGGLMSLAALPMGGGASLGGLGLSALGRGIFSADGGRVPHKADGGAVDGSNIDVVGAMAQALQLADAEMSAPQPAQPMPMADGGAAEIVHGALDLAQAMKRSFGGSADHMADGGVPGSTIGVIDVGGRKIPNIFPSSRLSASSFRAPDVKYAPVGDIKTPDYSSVMKGLGAAFKQPEPFTTFGTSQGQIGAEKVGSKGLPSFKVGADGQLPTLSGWTPVSSEAPKPIDYSMYSTPEYGSSGYTHGGVVPHHAKDGGSMFDPTPIEYQRPDDVLPTVDSEAAFAPEPIPGGAVAPKPITGETIPQVAEAPVSRARSTEESPYDAVWRRVIKQESGGKQFDREGRPLTSSAGAIGIAQVMPRTAPEAARLAGVEFDPVRYRNDAQYNEMIGRAYFDKQIKDFGGDVEKAAAAYNAGPARARQALARAQREGGSYLDYLPAETQNYVASIMSGGAGTASARDLSGARAMFAQQRGLGERSLPSDLTALDTVEGRVGPPVEPGVAPRVAEPPAAEAAPPPTQQQVARANRATSIFENLTGIQLSDEGRMAMMAMGLKMMTTPGSIGTAIGAGGLQGLATYAEAQRATQEQAVKQAQVRRELETERHNRMMEAINLQRQQISPISGYETPDGHPMGMDHRSGRVIDLITGKQVDTDATVRNTRNVWKPYNNKITEGGNPILINGQGQMMDATTKEILGPGSKIVDVKTGLLSDESRKARAIQLSMGDIKSAYAGFGYGDNINKKNVYDDAIKLLVDQGGMTVGQAAKYLSEQSQEWQSRGVGMSAEARTAGTREANLGIILKATDAAIPAALEASEKVARTGWVPLNQIIQKGQVIASNPELKEFGMANLQLAEHWARAMNPTGVMRESDRDLALGFLSTADSPQTYARAVAQLKKQIEREKGAVSGFRKTNGFDAQLGKENAITYEQSANDLKNSMKSSAAAPAPAPAEPPSGAVAPSATAPAKKTPPAGAVGTKKDTQGGSWYVDRNGNPIERVQ